jgi:uncharacterized protein (DUF2267 family)
MDDLTRYGGWDEEFAERAALCVLQLLEERLVGGEAEDLEAQLPSRLRSELQKGERREGRQAHKFGREDLLERVGRELSVPRDRVEPLVRSVFAAVRAHVSEGEAEDVAAQLPADLAALWIQPA